MARAPAMAEIEELPEADRLEGFPHPRETKELYGHAGAERMLAEALASGRMHHAWLLTGPQGIGKATLAYRFARAALALPEERDASGQSLAVAETTTRRAPGEGAVASGAAAHPPPVRHQGQALRDQHPGRRGAPAALVPRPSCCRRRLARRHRRRGGRAQPQRRQRAAEVAGGAADAHGVPARLLGARPPAADHPFAHPHAGAGPAGRPRLACRRRAGADGRRDARRPPRPQWAPLERLADGSAGRLLGLLGSGGIEQEARVTKLLSLLPKVDWRAVHALSDELQPIAAQPRFELFFELLLDALSPPHPRRRHGRGDRRGHARWPPASSGRPGLPRLPPCGKE